jgi:1,4-dihydroxy-2-naphthoyl-CoA hydrolase
MGFSYTRTIHFGDTDGAGVVFFANLLSICHEAYEAGLAEAGFDLRNYFSDRSGVIIPIVAAEAKYFRPMFCGDRLIVEMSTKQVSDSKFELNYQIFEAQNQTTQLAQAVTRHIAIDSKLRSPIVLSLEMQAWLSKFSDHCAMMGH